MKGFIITICISVYDMKTGAEKNDSSTIPWTNCLNHCFNMSNKLNTFCLYSFKLIITECFFFLFMVNTRVETYASVANC